MADVAENLEIILRIAPFAVCERNDMVKGKVSGDKMAATLLASAVSRIE